MLKALLVGIVRTSADRRWLTVTVAVLVASLAGIYAAAHFALNTDIDKLFSPNLSWRQDEIAFQRAFPNQEQLILAVIDAPTSELAETAADELTQRLKERHDVIRDAFEQGGGRFFRRNGLLFLPEPKLAEVLRQLSNSAPLLGTLALDPSLRGVMDSISLSLRGVQFHRITLEKSGSEISSLCRADPVRSKRSTGLLQLAQASEYWTARTPSVRYNLAETRFHRIGARRESNSRDQANGRGPQSCQARHSRASHGAGRHHR